MTHKEQIIAILRDSGFDFSLGKHEEIYISDVQVRFSSMGALEAIFPDYDEDDGEDE